MLKRPSRRFFILAVIAVLITGSVGLRAAVPRAPTIGMMRFTPAHADAWVVDGEVDIEDVDADHFFYRDHESIDLGIVRDDEDLFETLEAKGRDGLVAEILHGENLVNGWFDVGKTEVIETHLVSEGHYQVLTVRSKQQMTDREVQRLEKYFIAPGQTLSAQLRWDASADSKLLAEAQKSFDQGVFEIRETK